MPSPHFKHIWRIPGRALRGAILGSLAVAAVCLPLPVSAQDPGDLAAVPARDSQALDGGLGTAFLSPDLLPADDRRGVSAPMPRILGEAEARRYRELFRLPEDGELRAADRVHRPLEIGRASCRGRVCMYV